MLERTVERDGTIVLSDGLCTARAQRLGRGLIFATFAGAGSFTIDKAIMDMLSTEIEQSGFTSLYVDARGQQRVHPDTKNAAVTWGQQHGDQVIVHVLVGSKFMDMALSVIRLFVRMPLHTYSNETRFLEVLRRQVPTFGELPPLQAPGERRAG